MTRTFLFPGHLFGVVLIKGGTTMNDSELSSKAETLAEMLGSQALSDEQMLSIVGGGVPDTGDGFGEAFTVLSVMGTYGKSYEKALGSGMSELDAGKFAYKQLPPEGRKIFFGYATEEWKTIFASC
jgi:hypothetical protein